MTPTLDTFTVGAYWGSCAQSLPQENIRKRCLTNVKRAESSKTGTTKSRYIFNVSTGPREGLSSGISLLVGSGLSEVGWTTYRRELDSVPKLNDEIGYEKDEQGPRFIVNKMRQFSIVVTRKLSLLQRHANPMPVEHI